MSACSAWRLSAVSFSVSPFCKLDVVAEIFTTSALRRNAASSNEVRVRVLGSTKKLTIVFPRKAGTFLISREPTVLKAAAVSRIISISLSSNSRIPSRSFRCQFAVCGRSRDALESAVFMAFPPGPNRALHRRSEGGLSPVLRAKLVDFFQRSQGELAIPGGLDPKGLQTEFARGARRR